jgi:hypothetical protein
LGTVAEQRGDRAAALEHYSRAAQSDSPAGQAAQEAAMRLDFPQNPGKYLSVRGGLDNQGQLIVELANPTRSTITDVVVGVRYVDAQGQVRQINQQFRGQLAPNEAQRIATGLGPFSRPDAFEVGVVSARLAQ